MAFMAGNSQQSWFCTQRGDWEYLTTTNQQVSAAAPQTLNSRMTEAWIDPLWQVRAPP